MRSRRLAGCTIGTRGVLRDHKHRLAWLVRRYRSACHGGTALFARECRLLRGRSIGGRPMRPVAGRLVQLPDGVFGKDKDNGRLVIAGLRQTSPRSTSRTASITVRIDSRSWTWPLAPVEVAPRHPLRVPLWAQPARGTLVVVAARTYALWHAVNRILPRPPDNFGTRSGPCAIFRRLYPACLADSFWHRVYHCFGPDWLLVRRKIPDRSGLEFWPSGGPNGVWRNGAPRPST